MDNQSTQLDPAAVALTKAIGHVESGGNYNAVGDNGNSSGAYQFQQGTWQQYAKDVLGNSNAPMTMENQNKVAYGKVKAWKDQGYTPAQIASKWNSGGFDTYKNSNAKGTNQAQGVDFNVPAYVSKVSNQFKQNIGQNTQQNTGGFNPTPFSHPNPGQFDFSGLTQPTDQSNTPTGDQTLGQQLIGRANTAGQDILQGIQSKNPLLGGLQGGFQAVGEVAGGLGDIVNKGIELIPGVKALEGVIGAGVGKLAATPVGQSIVKSLQSFATAHPELSKDLGAGFNIATALPILDGIGAVKGAVLDGASQALKGMAENTVTKNWLEAGGKSVANVVAQSPDVIKNAIADGDFGTITDNKYDMKDAITGIDEKIANIDKTQLQPELAKANTGGISTQIPLEDLRQKALAEARNSLMPSSNVNATFDLIKEKYGDYPSLEQINEAKRTVSQRISEAAFGSDTQTANKVVRSTLQQGVEDGAAKLGLKDVGQINGQMRDLYQRQKLLEALNGKNIRPGLLGNISKDVGIAGGELAGNAVGIPWGGAILGRETGGIIGKRLAGIPQAILERANKNAVPGALKAIGKRVGKGALGAIAQKSAK